MFVLNFLYRLQVKLNFRRSLYDKERYRRRKLEKEQEELERKYAAAKAELEQLHKKLHGSPEEEDTLPTPEPDVQRLQQLYKGTIDWRRQLVPTPTMLPTDPNTEPTVTTADSDYTEPTVTTTDRDCATPKTPSGTDPLITPADADHVSSPTPSMTARKVIRSAGLTPRRVRPLYRQLTLTNAVLGTIRRMPLKRSLAKTLFSSSKVKKSRCISALSRAINVDWRVTKKYGTGKKEHQKSAFEQRKERVLQWFLLPENSVCMPGKKDYLVRKGVKHQRYVLQDYLAILHRQYIQQNPDLPVSFDVFKRVRRQHPWIGLVGSNKKDRCLCTYHENWKKLRQAVRAVPLPTDFDKYNSSTRVEDIKAILENGLKDCDTVDFSQWMTVTSTDRDKGTQWKSTQEVHLSEKRPRFIRIFTEKLVRFRAHTRRAVLQYRAVNTLKSNLPVGHVTLQMDFAENWQTASPVQSAYYGRAQISVHPAVAHFTKNGSLDHVSVVAVTDVRQHSAPTVFAVIRQLITVLQEKLDFPILHIHYISDSPSSQYRNISIFSLVARHSTIFGIDASWLYLEAGHGKGPCDGVGAVSKRVADDNAKAHQEHPDTLTPITNATTYVAWANLRSSIHHVEVTREQVEEAQSSTLIKSPYTVPGTMLIHHIVSPVPGYICARETACYGPCCMDSSGEPLLGCRGWSAHFIAPEFARRHDEQVTDRLRLIQRLRTTRTKRQTQQHPTTLSNKRKGRKKKPAPPPKPVIPPKRRIPTRATHQEDESDDDIPLSRLQNPLSDHDSDDDIPLVELYPLKKKRHKKRHLTKWTGSDSDDDIPLKQLRQ